MTVQGEETQNTNLLPLEPVLCPQGYRAWLLRLPAAPLEENRRAAVADSMVQLAEALCRESQLDGGLFLQNWKLSPQTGNDIVSQNLAAWKLQRGLGIWPGRPGPGSWTETSLMDAAAAAFQGEEPRLPVHHLLQLRIGGDEFLRAVTMLGGRGVALQIFTAVPLEQALTEQQAFFQTQVHESRFARSPFFLPLLDQANLGAFPSESELNPWMGAVRVYVRESAEDNGLLIVSHSAIAIEDVLIRAFANHPEHIAGRSPK